MLFSTRRIPTSQRAKPAGAELAAVFFSIAEGMEVLPAHAPYIGAQLVRLAMI